PSHVVGERRHRQLLRDLRLADERAGSPPPDEEAVSHEVVERRSQRQPRDSQVDAQLPLRRNRLADVELIDQLEDSVPGLALFGPGAVTAFVAVAVATGICSPAEGSGAETRLVPVSGSKKWKREGSTATVSPPPTRALVRASTRAANSVTDSASNVSPPT